MRNFRDAVSSGETAAGVEKSEFSTRSLYLQVFDRLVALMAEGTWSPGQMVAGELELAREFGVSVGTMRKALQLMVSQRLLTRARGRGTFVADPSTVGDLMFENLEDDRSGSMNWTVAELSVVRLEADAEERAALDLELSEIVIRRTRLMVDENSGTRMLETSSLAQKRFPALANDSSLHRLQIWQLAQASGYILSSSEQTIRLQRISAGEAKQLSTSPGEKLLLMNRIVFSLERIALELRIALCNPGPNTLYRH